MTRPLSLAALTVLELAPPEHVHCAADAGFTLVGLRLVPATPDEPQRDTVGDTPLVRATRRALDERGVRVLDVEILRLRPDTDIAGFQAVLDTAAALGARYLLVAGHDADETRLADRFAALCERAAPLGLAACIEPMPWLEVREVRQAARIVERSGARNAGVLVDPIHFDRAGSTPADLADIPPLRLPYLQFCDAPRERPTTREELLRQARAARLPPGEGGLDLRGLLAAAPAGVPLSLEVPFAGGTALERARKLRQACETLLARVSSDG
jgi:sugar phosphate isomerase/epimerase